MVMGKMERLYTIGNGQRVGSNPRRQSKNIEMKYKTHIKLVQ